MTAQPRSAEGAGLAPTLTLTQAGALAMYDALMDGRYWARCTQGSRDTTGARFELIEAVIGRIDAQLDLLVPMLPDGEECDRLRESRAAQQEGV